MGLGSALSTAVSGLNVNQNAIDVIGNNLANVNTTAFKASRNEFINNFYNTISVGSTPDANTAGKNPVQIGQGSTTGSVSVDFRPGAPTQTGSPATCSFKGTDSSSSNEVTNRSSPVMERFEPTATPTW